MRIVLLSAEYWPIPGGVGDYTQRLGAALAHRGHAVNVWTLREQRLVALDPTDPHNQITASFGRTNWGWGCWQAIADAVQQAQPDVLHIQYQTGAYAMHPAINLLPWRLSRSPRQPTLVITAHDLLLPYLFPKAGPLRNWVTRHLFEDSDATIVTNPDDLAQLVDGQEMPATRRTSAANIPRFTGRLRITPQLIPIGSNITVHPPTNYDRAAWRARLGIAPDETLVAYFGLISATKGLDVLLDAFERLPERFRLLIIGGEAPAAQDRAYAASLRARIAGPQWHGRVIITGQCPEQEVSAHLLAADMAALPFGDGASFRRGSLLAALAHGLAVVTTTIETPDQAPQNHRATEPRIPSLLLPTLIDQQNVALVPIGDPNALAARIQQLDADPALRERLGNAGRTLVGAFSWEAIATRHLDLYHDLLHTS
ncbi:MAG: glycosyltransferase family 4 protein [Roseiflexaceae bacterium]|nr:glycosyltransferase family 4 protein [Roseiflexaceae bacterium]